MAEEKVEQTIADPEAEISVGYNEEEYSSLSYGDDEFKEEEREKPSLTQNQAREQANTVAFAHGEDVSDDAVTRMATSLQSGGVSSELNTKVQEMARSRQEARLKAAGQLSGEIGTEQATSAFQSATEEDKKKDVVEDIEETANLNFLATIKDPQDTEEQFWGKAEEDNNVRAQISKELAQSRKWEGSWFGDLGDIGGAILPFNEQATINGLENALNDYFGVRAGKLQNAFAVMGETKTALRDIITDLEPQEQLQVLRVADKWLRANAGILGGNDMLRVGIMDELFEGAENQYLEGNLDITRHINNAASILDLAMVGGIVRAVGKGGRAGQKAISHINPRSPLAAAERNNTSVGEALKDAAIKDTTGKTANDLGTTPDEILANSMHRHSVADEIENFSGGSSEVLDMHRRVASEITADRSVADFLKPTEIANQIKREYASVKAFKGGSVFPNFSSVNRTDFDFTVKARVGKNGLSGYTKDEVRVAEAKFKSRNPEYKTKIIEVEHSGNGKYVSSVAAPKAVSSLKKTATESVSAKTTAKVEKAKAKVEKARAKLSAATTPSAKQKAASEFTTASTKLKALNVKVEDQIKESFSITQKPEPKYFVELEVTKEYGTSVKDADLLIDEDIFVSGRRAAWIADISTGLSPKIARGITGAFNASKHTEALMFRMLDPLFKPNVGKASPIMKRNVQKRVVSLLQEGSSRQKTFTPEEIRGDIPLDVSLKEVNATIDGYLSVRRLFDTMFVLENKAMRSFYEAKGAAHIKVGEFQTLGRPLDVDRAVSHKGYIYDPEAGKVIELKASEIKDIYAQGGRVVKSFNSHGIGDKSTYALVRKATDDIHQLPSTILHKKEGYIPRLYKENFFITAKSKKGFKLNGTNAGPSERVIGTAGSEREAKEVLARYQDENPNEIIGFKTDRGLSLNQKQDAESELAFNGGRLFYGKRGGHLRDVEGELSDTQDLMYSVQAGASSLARNIDLGPAIQVNKDRWMSEFSDLVPNRAYPGRWEDIQNTANAADPRVGKAIAYWRYIDGAENGGHDAQKWRNFAFNVGNWVSNKTGSDLAVKASREVGNISPIGLVRAAAFLPMIAYNPARQFFINILQPMFLATLEPSSIVQSYGRGVNLFQHAVRRGNPTKAEAVLAGMSLKEYTSLVNDFRSSGLLDAVTSHHFVRDGFAHLESLATNAKAPYIPRALGRGIKTANNEIIKKGFGAGEGVNRAVTYMVARSRVKKNGLDLNSRAGRLEVNREADNLTLSMGQPGALKYQEGWMSPALQFFAVQHKMMLSSYGAMLGKGNKSLSKAEGLRIAMGQLMIYGVAGAGITHAVKNIVDEQGIEIDEESKHLLYGGLFDHFVNKALGESDLAFSESIAGGGGFGSMMIQYTKAILDGDKTFAEIAAGPSSNSFSRFAEATRRAAALFGVTEIIDEADQDDALAQITRISSGANNYIKGQAMKTMGSWVDNNLNALGIPASQTEATVHQILGIQGYKVKDFYDGIHTEKKREDSLNEEAKRIAGDIARQTEVGANDRAFARTKQLSRMYNYYAHYYSSLGADGPVLAKKVRAILKRNEGREFGKFFENFSKAVTNNKYGEDTRTELTSKLNSGLITKDQHDKMLKVWEFSTRNVNEENQ